jgi:hypothetical protein
MTVLQGVHTYGGHYRVWPICVKKFLDQPKMDIPFDFVFADDRVLIIDDETDYAVLKNAIVAELPDVGQSTDVGMRD